MKPSMLLVATSFLAAACGSDASKNAADSEDTENQKDAGTTSPPDAGTTNTSDASGGDASPHAAPPVRSSCGDVPIAPVDFPADQVPDECKACVDTQCCDEANECAADPDCSAYRECITSCTDDESCAACKPGPVNGAFTACRATCAACSDLSCAGKQLPTPPATVHWTLHFQNFLSPTTPIDGMRLRLCNLSDVECAAPMLEKTTDTDGNVDLDLPTEPGGIKGYFELTSPAIQPTLWFPRLVHPETYTGLNSNLLDTGTASALRGALGAPDDATRGAITVQAVSCGLTNLPGVTIASSAADADTIVGYNVSGLPSVGATQSDGKGAAGHILNHASGSTTVTVTDAASGKKIGSTEVVVRAGFLSAVGVVPGL